MLSKIQRFAKANRIIEQAQRAHSSNSVFGAVTMAPPDPILGLNDAFKKDTASDKVLLGMGAYRCDNGKPYILKSVAEAEKRIMAKNMDHEYAPIDGIATYKEAALRVALGDDHDIIKDGRYAAMQSLSGTGSLRTGFEFLKEWYPKKDAKIYIPDPSWPTHKGIALRSGFDTVAYRYYDR
jgi:aspartate aminotransferase